MGISIENLQRLRGKGIYEGPSPKGIIYLRGVAQGSFEGKIASFQNKAIPLVEFASQLDEQSTNTIFVWLGEGSSSSVEHALTRMMQEREQEGRVDKFTT